MRRALVTAILAASFVHPVIALAQDATATPPPADVSESTQTDGAIFRGIRLEGDIGGDRFTSQHDHHTKLGYGGTVGFDGQYNRFVLGAEGSFWHADGRNVAYRDYGPNAVQQESYREWGAAVRAGYLLSPEFLVFGKAGFVNNEQHTFNIPPAGGPATLVSENTDGYQLGGGVEYSMPMMGLPVYVNAQYVYSQYDNHSSRQRLMGGIGIRFR
jgi:outer membrane immunogenic protein